MTVYEWLEQAKTLDEFIDERLALKSQILAMATKVNTALDGMPRSSGVSDKVGNGAIRLREWADEINTLIDEYIDLKQDMINTLQLLPDAEHAVLFRLYLLYETQEEAAEALGYSRVTIWRIKSNAVKSLQKILSNVVE